MRYYVQRGQDESGPYTLGSLRRRVDAGDIFFSDLVRSQQSASWMPVGQFLATMAGFVLLCCAEVAMARDLEAYYNSTENIGLRLSGAMVFFFNVFYFQYHFSRIAKWKKTGVLKA